MRQNRRQTHLFSKRYIYEWKNKGCIQHPESLSQCCIIRARGKCVYTRACALDIVLISCRGARCSCYAHFGATAGLTLRLFNVYQVQARTLYAVWGHSLGTRCVYERARKTWIAPLIFEEVEMPRIRCRGCQGARTRHKCATSGSRWLFHEGVVE